MTISIHIRVLHYNNFSYNQTSELLQVTVLTVIRSSVSFYNVCKVYLFWLKLTVQTVLQIPV